MRSYDYLNIGANGFAQLGSEDYHAKNQTEMEILLDHLNTVCPVPEKFSQIAKYKVMSFNHDFGMYHEIVIWYNRNHVDNWELEDETLDTFDEFWDWANEAESVDMESEILTEKIRSTYLGTLDLEKSEHLRIAV